MIIKKKQLLWKNTYFYQSFWFTKFVNKLMIAGKKQKTLLFISRVLRYIKKELLLFGTIQHIFLTILEYYRPMLGSVICRQARLTHQVPVPIHYKRSFKLLLKWLCNICKKTVITTKIIENHISTELIKIIISPKMNTLRTKVTNERLAITENKIYLHFRWV